MFKVFGFLTKREGMQMQDFIDYYENKHVPLICSLAPTPSLYKRRYIMRGEELTQEGGAVDFDVMAELGFPDRAYLSKRVSELCCARDFTSREVAWSRGAGPAQRCSTKPAS